MILFEAKISYLQEDAKGELKRKSETDIVEAETYAECEDILFKQCDLNELKEPSIKGMKIITVSEIFRDETKSGESWYRVRVVLIDPETEKGSNQIMFVEANTIDEANHRLKDNMKGTLVDWESTEIKKTNIYNIITK